ncbi:ShlB/FhaC/HecB family hemolysin secretion/activation protein [Sphingomonas pituitosa]|uniref:ShlB/FhaC/HecB family hemolysin secretion/activation protein n=1 Tax=Sphingomonas pituitosa TaxID=99597 RepID=UPI00082AF7BF|nr:ShlB/FhaC/HecB family hemolysin secretion/activation protein [Sphingomonas pituitosa]
MVPVLAAPCAAQTIDADNHGTAAPAPAETRILVSAIRILDLQPRPEIGITAESIQRIADAALRDQANGALPAALSFVQIKAVADSVTQAYRRAGLMVATAIVPPQDIAAGGTLTLRILEGKVGQIKVQGSKRYRDDVIAATLRPLVGQPLQRRSLEQATLYARDLPGVTISPMLTAGANPGETDIIIVAKDNPRPYAVRLGTSNYGTDTIGRYRFEAGITLYSPLGIGDVLAASFAYSVKPSNSWAGSASYTLPLDRASGLSATMGFLRSQLQLRTGPFAALDIHGPTTQAYAGIDWKFINRPTLKVQASGRYIHETSRLDGLGLRLSSYRFDVLDAGLAVRADQRKSHAVNFAQIGLRRAIHDGSSSANVIFSPHESQFWSGRWSLSRIQGIAPGHRLIVRGNGQVTDDALPPLEQFSIGGPTSVRSATLSAALGDRGVQATVEYQVDAPGFASAASPFAGRSWGDLLTVQAFYDWGRVSPVARNRRLGALPAIFEGAGIGLEFRLPYQQGVQLNLSAALPTRRHPNTDRAAQIWAGLGFTF